MLIHWWQCWCWRWWCCYTRQLVRWAASRWWRHPWENTTRPPYIFYLYRRYDACSLRWWWWWWWWCWAQFVCWWWWWKQNQAIASRAQMSSTLQSKSWSIWPLWPSWPTCQRQRKLTIVGQSCLKNGHNWANVIWWFSGVKHDWEWECERKVEVFFWVSKLNVVFNPQRKVTSLLLMLRCVMHQHQFETEIWSSNEKTQSWFSPSRAISKQIFLSHTNV